MYRFLLRRDSVPPSVVVVGRSVAIASVAGGLAADGVSAFLERPILTTVSLILPRFYGCSCGRPGRSLQRRHVFSSMTYRIEQVVVILDPTSKPEQLNTLLVPPFIVPHRPSSSRQ